MTGDNPWSARFAERERPVTPAFMEQLLDFLERSGIPAGDVCVLGSSVLAWEGVRLNRDVDFAVHSRWRHHMPRELPDFLELDTDGARYSGISGGALIGDRLFEAEVSQDFFAGLKAIRPEIEYAFKANYLRARDLLDLHFLDLVARKNSGWSWPLFQAYYDSGLQPAPPADNSAQIGRWQILKYSLPLRFLRRAKRFAVRRWSSLRGLKKRWLARRCSDPRFRLPGDLHLEPSGAVDIANVMVYLRSNNRNVYVDVITAMALLDSSAQEEPEAAWLESWQRIFFDDSSRDWGIVLERFIADFSRMRSTNPAWHVDLSGSRPDSLFPLIAALRTRAPSCQIATRGSYQSAGGRGGERTVVAAGSSSCIAWDREEFRILTRSGVYWPLIVWPTGEEYLSQIEDFLKTKCHVVAKRMVRHSRDELGSFLRELYGGDGTDWWQVEYKISAMFASIAEQRVHNVCVFFLELEHPIFEPKFKTESFRSSESQAMRRLKTEIRTTFSPLVENYINDILVHGGDNFADNRDTVRALEMNGLTIN